MPVITFVNVGTILEMGSLWCIKSTYKLRVGATLAKISLLCCKTESSLGTLIDQNEQEVHLAYWSLSLLWSTLYHNHSS